MAINHKVSQEVDQEQVVNQMEVRIETQDPADLATGAKILQTVNLIILMTAINLKDSQEVVV